MIVIAQHNGLHDSFLEEKKPIGVVYVKNAAFKSPIALPFYLSSVAAGFPSPADDWIENELDLNEHLIPHPAATYLVRASGHSMINAGIHDGDLLIVDRSIDPAAGQIVIAAVDGELTVKRLRIKNNTMSLVAENPLYKEIIINPESDVVIWGVVIHAIHSYKGH